MIQKILNWFKSLFFNKKPIVNPPIDSVVAVDLPLQLPVPKGKNRIKGLDIYSGDNVSSWADLQKAEFKFCSIKASEGMTFRDSAYKNHKLLSEGVDIISGPYHFMHFNQNMKLQAEFFCQVIMDNGGLQDGDLPPMADWEYANGDPSPGDDKLARIFIERVRDILGVRPIIYVSYFVVQALNNPEWLKEYPLWLPWYADELKIKTPLPWVHWHFWQYSGTSRIPGLSNLGDIDVFNGDLEDLKALIRYCEIR